MNKRVVFVSQTVFALGITLAILTSLPGMGTSSVSQDETGEESGRGPLNPALCKDTSSLCPNGPIPYAYLLSLPHTSPITNETELFQSIPGAVFVSKFNPLDDTYQRWNGIECCKGTKLKFGVVSDCQSAAPGGCFAVHADQGEAFGVVVNGPGRYTILGVDASSTFTLNQTAAGVSKTGSNLISVPYCSTTTTAKQLMDSIGLSRVTSVARYLSFNDTFQSYTGRAPQSSANNFALVPGEAYFVRMKTTTAYASAFSAGCTPTGCTGCGPDGTACDDGNGCTSNDQCTNGACSGVSPIANCDDGNPDTIDACNGCTGLCTNAVDPCAVPANNGTVDLPPVTCPYISGGDLHDLIDGLPSGTEVHVSAIHGGFTVITRVPSLREPNAVATTETFDSHLTMHITGTGILAGVDCNLSMNPLHTVVESQPAQPGQPVQDFDTDMKSLTGTLTNDSSCNLFQSLGVTAGTDHGLPSPGHVHLQLRDDGGYDVATFFSVNVTMSFVGKGLLEGYSGSTTQTVVMGPPTTIPPGATLIDSISPPSKTRPPGTSHSITMFLSDLLGHPVTNRPVAFSVISGPNTGAVGTCSSNPACDTDADGRVTFSYTSNGAFGSDQIQACPNGGSCSTVSVDWACIANPPNSPDEVDNGVRLNKNGGNTDITWVLAPGATTSDVVRGALSGLPVGPGGGDEVCLASDVVTTLASDGMDPASGQGFWYLVRGDNVCGKGPYGFQVQNGVPTSRSSTTCP